MKPKLQFNVICCYLDQRRLALYFLVEPQEVCFLLLLRGFHQVWRSDLGPGWLDTELAEAWVPSEPMRHLQAQRQSTARDLKFNDKKYDVTQLKISAAISTKCPFLVNSCLWKNYRNLDDSNIILMVNKWKTLFIYLLHCLWWSAWYSACIPYFWWSSHQLHFHTRLKVKADWLTATTLGGHQLQSEIILQAKQGFIYPSLQSTSLPKQTPSPSGSPPWLPASCREAAGSQRAPLTPVVSSSVGLPGACAQAHPASARDPEGGHQRAMI